MISFKEYVPSTKEKDAFIDLMKREITYSKKMEEMIFVSRRRNRVRYFLLQRELRLEEMQ